jgi:hypothetical protein
MFMQVSETNTGGIRLLSNGEEKPRPTTIRFPDRLKLQLQQAALDERTTMEVIISSAFQFWLQQRAAGKAAPDELTRIVHRIGGFCRDCSTAGRREAG